MKTKTANLALARHLDGSRVKRDDLVLDLMVTFPNTTGGITQCVCTKINDEVAIFESVRKSAFYDGFKMRFNQPDFTVKDFQFLIEAFQEMEKWGGDPTNAHHDIIRRAHSFGYAFRQSYTQAGWTELGINTYKAALIEEGQKEHETEH